MRLLSALAWIGCGLLTGYLAFVQIGLAGSIFDDGSLTALAAWNGLIAAGVLYGAAKLLNSTKPSTFRTSAMWAAFVVLVQGFQIAQGATHFAYIGSTLAALGGGLFAWMVYSGLPRDGKEPEPASPTPYERAQQRPATQRILIAVLGLLAVLVVLWVAGRISG